MRVSSYTPILISPPVIGEASKAEVLNTLSVTYSGEPQVYLENLSVLGIVTHGEGTLRVNGVEFDLCEGNLLQLHDHHIYMIGAKEALTVTFLPAGICALIEAVKLLEKDLGGKFFYRLMSPIVKLTPESAKTARTLYEQADAVKDDPAAKAVRLGYVLTAHSLEAEPTEGSIDPKSLVLGWQMYNYLVEHYREPLTEETLAQLFDCIPHEVNYHLRKVCAYNLKTLLNRFRAKNAVFSAYFQTGTLPEVSKSSGFKSVSVMFKAVQKMNDYNGLGVADFIKKKYAMPSAFDQRFPMLMEYILYNFRENISIESAADALGIKVISITTLLEGLSLPPFFELVQYLRINYAVNLLQISDRNVLDIALDSGYNSINTFFNHFKKHKNCSPSEYRAMFKRE